MGGGIDREEQPVRLQRRVQVAEHDAGLDQRGARRRVDVQDRGADIAEVDHQRAVDGLPALAGAGAAGKHRHAFLAAIASAAATSSMLRGTITPIGSTW